MDAVLRILQAAGDGAPAPFVAIVDEVHAIGGDAILNKLFELVVNAVSDGRWPGLSVTVAAISEPPSAYHHLVKRLGKSPDVHYIDCWTNPYGWPISAISEKKKQQHREQSRQSLSGGAATLPLFQSPSKGLDELSRCILAQSKTVLFIDSMSPLVDVFGLPSVCSFLTTLRNSGVSIVFLLHADLHSQHEVSTLFYGTSCLVELVPANERPEHYIQPHGRLSLKFRRKSGAVKTEGLDYRINLNSGLEILAPVVSNGGAVSTPSTGPANAGATVVAPQTKAGTASAAPASTTTSITSLGQQLAGGMRLDVSAEEDAARRQVQLPYEHQGQGQLYASGGDFRDYLPEAAGGRRRGTGRLGHILYVRDSDSEDPDSDEDPDDDLDV